MGSTWTSIVTVLFTISAAALTCGRRLIRAIMTDANFFTYRFEVVLEERKRRLDIAQHLRHLGEHTAAEEQVKTANQLVARACLLTRESPTRAGRNRAGAVAYGAAVLSIFLLGMSVVLSLAGQPEQATLLGVIGAATLACGAVPALLVLAYFVETGDKKARENAIERAAHYTNPTTYPDPNKAENETETLPH